MNRRNKRKKRNYSYSRKEHSSQNTSKKEDKIILQWNNIDIGEIYWSRTPQNFQRLPETLIYVEKIGFQPQTQHCG